MDEAERCHKLAYLAYGRLLAQGAAAEIVAAQQLAHGRSSRARSRRALERLRGEPGVDQAASFGATLHVNGRDAARARGDAAGRRRGHGPLRGSRRRDRPRGRVHPPDAGATDDYGSGDERRETHARRFSITRWWGIVLKEFLQLRRDRITFGMVIGMPIVQIGAVRLRDQYRPAATCRPRRRGGPQRVHAQLPRGDEEHPTTSCFVGSFGRGGRPGSTRARRVQFVVTSRPTSRAAAARRTPVAADRGGCDRSDGDPGRRWWPRARLDRSVRREGSDRCAPPCPRAGQLRSTCGCIGCTTPRADHQYNIVPGLMGVILTMTMVMMTGLATTRDASVVRWKTCLPSRRRRSRS